VATGYRPKAQRIIAASPTIEVVDRCGGTVDLAHRSEVLAEFTQV
jgi:hypothetical protein